MQQIDDKEYDEILYVQIVCIDDITKTPEKTRCSVKGVVIDNVFTNCYKMCKTIVLLNMFEQLYQMFYYSPASFPNTSSVLHWI